MMLLLFAGSCGDGAIEPSSPDGVSSCAKKDCSGHGECREEACTCDAGYAGADCSDCANGYEPSGDECIANANLVISAGFEEVNGESGVNAPTDNYPFGTSYATFWDIHIAGTEVVSDCSGRTAFEGNHYWHLQFRSGHLDPCLGTIPTSVNSHSNIGQDFAYPMGTQNRTNLDEVITSDTMTIRFVFRTTGNWTATNPVDNGGGLKFIRVFGNGGWGDDAAALLKTLNDGDRQDSRWYVHNPAGPHTTHDTGIDTQDGDWHSVVYAVHINNRTGSEDNITATFWIDDWEMSGPGYSETITSSAFGTNFRTIELFANWSANYPVDDMGLDIDQIEVWNGLP